MSTPATDYTLAELMIVAASQSFANEGEVLATGIGVIPRIAASLAMKTTNPDLMMTDSEAYLLHEPNPLSRDSEYVQRNETWMGFSRIFDNVWSGKRHAMIGPTQIDRFGQANISCIGGTYEQPKVQMLGMRGLPGNSISHGNSFFVPSHNSRVFVAGECDVVNSIGYNPERLPKGYSFDDIEIGLIITDLCVLDFGGANKAVRLVSLHPGITVEQVVENTGFPLEIPADVAITAAPTEQQLEIIRAIDPRDFRSKQLKDNPKGDRS
ncbi:glutaconate CoA-transferase subunit B [Sinobacterium caligoides]|uniref:Glutaconate CoA-transferase subunit B n=1 Tax=Sinobacterium caligoides TaxID=933926 RepID=A0A3N2E0Q6_9GAMM|nr:ketoacid CoA transferase [Sinobacterium caligoides]ROS05617.1 glutaconate CoA-transferase subunit B [Sinobacterium caligoides]